MDLLKKIFIGIALISCYNTYAQSNIFKVNLSNPLLEKAVEKSICIVQHDYVLEHKNGERFYKGTNEYYDRVFGIGIFAENVIWTNNFVSNSYPNNDQELTPVITKTKVKPITKNNFQYINIPIENRSEELYTIEYKENKNLESLGCRYRDLNEFQWVYVLYADSSWSVNPNTPIKKAVFRTIPQHEDSIYTLDVIPVKGIPIGAAVFDVVTSTGQTNFLLSGILTQKQNSNKWQLHYLSDINNIKKEKATKNSDPNIIKITLTDKKGKSKSFRNKQIKIKPTSKREQIYTSDNNGIISLMLDADEKGIVMINGYGGFCIEDNRQSYRIACRYKKNKITPLNIIDTCK